MSTRVSPLNLHYSLTPSVPGLSLILAGAEVTRFHTVPGLRPETVGHHTFVALWIAQLCCRHAGGASASLMLALLVHDVPEGITGDVPSPTKRALLATADALDNYEADICRAFGLPLVALTAIEQWVLKLADNMAGMAYCLRERAMGNTLVEVSYSRYRAYTQTLVNEAPIGTAAIMRSDVEYIFTSIDMGWRNYVSE